MSVTICKERPQSRSGVERKDGTREYRRVFYVETSDKTDDAIKVLLAPGLPALFSIYDVGGAADLGALCINREPNQIGPKSWEVTLTYDSAKENPSDPGGGGGGNQQKEPDPEKWYEKISITFNPVEEAIYSAFSINDYDPYVFGGVKENVKRSITNSAGEPYDPPLMKTIYHPILTFNLFRESVNIESMMQYIGATNSDIFWGATPRQLRINKFETSGIEYKRIQNIDVWYYPVTVEMEYHKDTWDLRPLDYGTYWVSGTGASIERHAFMTKDGQPYNGLLDGNGGKLADTGEPKFRRYRVYEELPFNTLGLPAAMPPHPPLLGQ